MSEASEHAAREAGDPERSELDHGWDVDPEAFADAQTPESSVIEDLVRERDDMRALAQRVQADFENYKKRVQRDQAETAERSAALLVEQLLPVLDSFDLALSSLGDADEKVRKGVELVYADLVAVLERAGVERIATDGMPFDPEMHEAVLHEPGDGEPTVVGTMRSGYRLKGRVLRPAMVKVAGEEPEQQDSEHEQKQESVAPQREWFEKDYYQVLGVDPSATEKDITRAYRKLAKQYHPDANPGDLAAEERFKEVSAANEVLGDAEKRKEYDQVREMAASGMGPGGFGGGGFPGGGFGAGGQTFNFDDVGLGDILGGLFGQGAGGGRSGRRGRRNQAQGPAAGADLQAELHLDFLDAVHGVTTSVHLTGEAVCSTCHGSGAKPGTTPDVCPSCAGTGEVVVDQGPFSFSQVCPQCGGRGAIVKDKCRTCKGRGVEVRPREVKVKIPAGVQGGQRIRVAGRGAPGRFGGPPGDLFVVVHVHHHEVFGRSGKANLTVRLPITFVEAALGAQVKVPTLDTPVTVKVKPGTQSGTTVKVPKRGITPAKGDPGDLLVTFVVEVPTDPTDEQKAAIEALAATMPDNPRVDLGV